jgi:hypothetical protein
VWTSVSDRNHHSPFFNVSLYCIYTAESLVCVEGYQVKENSEKRKVITVMMRSLAIEIRNLIRGYLTLRNTKEDALYR